MAAGEWEVILHEINKERRSSPLKKNETENGYLEVVKRILMVCRN